MDCITHSQSTSSSVTATPTSTRAIIGVPHTSSPSSTMMRGTGANSGPLGGVAGLADDDSEDEDAFLQSLGLKQNIKKGAKVALTATAANTAGGNKKKAAVAAKDKNVIGGGSFQSMALSPNLLKSLLHRGFTTPTPIQRAALPSALMGRDIVGMARTGSGKTLAYMVPLIQKLGAVHSPRYGARALVLVPTRELALQVLKVGKDIARGAGSRASLVNAANKSSSSLNNNSIEQQHGNNSNEQLRWGLVVGGDSLEEQYALMASNPDVLIATPGRLLHLLVEMSADLRSVEFLVFDEADRLFELGFETALTEIISKLAPSRQTLLFSATLPKSLVEFAKAGLQNPKLVRLDAESKISSDLQMAFVSVKPKEKEAALLLLLRDVIETPLAAELPSYGEAASDDDDIDDAASRFRKRKRDTKFAGGGARKSSYKGKRPGNNGGGLVDLAAAQSIVFAATKHHVEYLSTMLTSAGYAVSSIYGAMDQVARLSQLGRFRAGKTSVMVVTDLAARGIDIPLLPNVVNYDFPTSARTFVHRVGRTARAGRKGWAYSFVTNSELPHLFDLQLFLGRPLVPAPTSIDDFANNLVLGTVPRDRLDLDSDHFRTNILEPSSTLVSLLGVAEKGQKMYEKSQGKASQESYRRAKELVAGAKGLAGSEREEDGVHPIFANLVPKNSAGSAVASASTASSNTANGVSRSDLLAQINAFRPSETVLEIGNRGKTAAAQIMQKRRVSLGKAKARQAGQSNGNDSAAAAAGSDQEGDDNAEESLVDINGNMGELADEDDIEEAFHTSGRSSGKKQKDFRDPSVYLGYVQEGAEAEKGYSLGAQDSFAAQAASSAYDLTAGTDEMDGRLAPQKASMLRWDRKHKKFVKGDGTGSDNKKLIRTESGGKLPASFKSGSFDDWKRKQKVYMPKVGDAELKNRQMPNSGPGGVGKRWRHTGVVAARGAGDKPRRDGKGGFVKDFSNKKRKPQSGGSGDGESTGVGGKTRSSTSEKVRGGKGSASQLKSVDQIRKERLLKAKRTKRSTQPGKRKKK